MGGWVGGWVALAPTPAPALHEQLLGCRIKAQRCLCVFAAASRASCTHWQPAHPPPPLPAACRCHFGCAVSQLDPTNKFASISNVWWVHCLGALLRSSLLGLLGLLSLSCSSICHGTAARSSPASLRCGHSRQPQPATASRPRAHFSSRSLCPRCRSFNALKNGQPVPFASCCAADGRAGFSEACQCAPRPPCK